jgi:hypothetical protein
MPGSDAALSPNTRRRLFRDPGDQLSVPVSADMAAAVRLGGENASAQLRQASPAVRLALQQHSLCRMIVAYGVSVASTTMDAYIKSVSYDVFQDDSRRKSILANTLDLVHVALHGTGRPG